MKKIKIEPQLMKNGHGMVVRKPQSILSENFVNEPVNYLTNCTNQNYVPIDAVNSTQSFIYQNAI